MLLALVLATASSGVLSSWSFGQSLTQVARADAPPIVGFSFSPVTAEFYGDEPSAALASLLVALSPDLVRLPVFWDQVEPRKDEFNYTELDRLMATISQHNRLTRAHPTRVVLIIGARNMGHPEVFLPAWVPAAQRDPLAGAAESQAYKVYARRTVQRYAHSVLLAAWQVENEALDNVLTPAGRSVAIPAEDLVEDISVIHQLDSVHPAIVTTFNNSTLSLDIDQMSAPNARKVDESGATPVGHPQRSLQIGDVLGLDAYVAIGSTSLDDASVAERVAWKATGLHYWSDEARATGKQMWITEMQGQVWPSKTNFTPADLVMSARNYRRVGASVVLLWGVESWLHQSAWMSAGQQARQLLGN